MQSKIKIDLNQIPCAYVATNLENKITAVNQTLCEWLAMSENELLGKHISEIMTTPSRMLFLGSLLPHIQHYHHTEENYLTFKVSQDSPLPVMLNAQKITHDGQAYISYAFMKMNRRHLIEEQLIQERRRAEMAIEEKEALNIELQLAQKALIQKQKALELKNTELESLSTTDSLTKLFNRRVFEREIETQLALHKRSHQCFSMILFDIDHFKKINDQHGHDAGDSVLIQFAETLTQHLRQIDILTRIGGEEFVLILPNTEIEQAREVAERHRQTIENSNFVSGKVTASFGVTAVQTEDNAMTLYKRADTALYEAKQQGRNCVVAR